MAASNTTTYAIRYRRIDAVEVVYPKTGLNRDEMRIALGVIIDAAHAKGIKLDYIRVVPCVKRPGTRTLFEMSRRALTEEQLVHYCNVYHRVRVAAGR